MRRSNYHIQQYISTQLNNLLISRGSLQGTILAPTKNTNWWWADVDHCLLAFNELKIQLEVTHSQVSEREEYQSLDDPLCLSFLHSHNPEVLLGIPFSSWIAGQAAGEESSIWRSRGFFLAEATNVLILGKPFVAYCADLTPVALLVLRKLHTLFHTFRALSVKEGTTTEARAPSSRSGAKTPKNPHKFVWSYNISSTDPHFELLR